jgi:photosystem II stability/assembly factor-like uncharacterized protein
MRKLLPLFVFSLFALTSNAQWESQASGFSDPFQGINQIVITDATSAWATSFDDSGNGNTLQQYTRTTDGGLTWVPSTVTTAPATYEWSCFAAVDDQNAWAMFYDAGLGVKGGIFGTTDGGQTWTPQESGQIFSASASFPDVLYFWEASTGVAVGDPINGEYEIYTTTDGGVNWILVDGANIPNPTNGEFGLTRSFAARGNSFWFGTNKGRLYKTTDFGATWTVYSTGTTDAVVSLDFADEMVGWVELSNNTSFAFKSIQRTIDGGATWTNITPAGTFFNPSKDGGLAYVPYTAYTLVASGYDNTNLVYGSAYSLDAGDTWVTIDSDVFHFAVSFLDNLTGWSGGVNTDYVTDGMWKYSGAFVATNVKGIELSEFNLYPNPSGGLFYFSFDAPNDQPLHIRVTDAIGRTVFEKVYKDRSETWLRPIDLRNFSKGIYFLNLENNGNYSSEKLVIN